MKKGGSMYLINLIRNLFKKTLFTKPFVIEHSTDYSHKSIDELIVDNHVKEVKDWVEKGGDVNLIINGKSLLFRAIESSFNNGFEITRYLLEKGASVDVFTSTQQHLLIHFYEKQNALHPIYLTLIDLTFDKKTLNQMFLKACHGLDFALAFKLINQHHVDISESDKDGLNALHILSRWHLLMLAPDFWQYRTWTSYDEYKKLLYYICENAPQLLKELDWDNRTPIEIMKNSEEIRNNMQSIYEKYYLENLLSKNLDSDIKRVKI